MFARSSEVFERRAMTTATATSAMAPIGKMAPIGPANVIGARSRLARGSRVGKGERRARVGGGDCGSRGVRARVVGARGSIGRDGEEDAARGRRRGERAARRRREFERGWIVAVDVRADCELEFDDDDDDDEFGVGRVGRWAERVGQGALGRGGGGWRGVRGGLRVRERRWIDVGGDAGRERDPGGRGDRGDAHVGIHLE